MPYYEKIYRIKVKNEFLQVLVLDSCKKCGFYCSYR